MPEYQDEVSVKDVSQTTKLSDKLKLFLVDLRKTIQDHDIDGTDMWRTKMITARNQRQGVKRVTDIPYPGAPDIPLPETDKLIRKQKPQYVMSAISGKKYMLIEPASGVQAIDDNLKQMAMKAELAMNHLFQNHIKWTQKLTLNADRFLEKGKCIFKIIERYKSRIVSKVVDIREYPEEMLKQFKSMPKSKKLEFLANRYGLDLEDDKDKKTLNKIIDDFSSGKEIINFDIEEVVCLPDVLTPMPEKVYVPKGTVDIEHSARVTHEYYLRKDELVNLAMGGLVDKEKVMRVIEKGNNNIQTSDDGITEKIKDSLEGISNDTMSGEYYKIHETCCWYQEDEDKPYKRWLFMFFADIGNIEEAVIKRISYPYEFDGWNFIDHNNEIIDERYYASRGVPEQIRAIQEFMERGLNNMIIRDEMMNAPIYTVLNTSGVKQDDVRFIPGSKISVSNHDEIRQLNPINTTDVSSANITQILKAYAEEYLGQTDQLFRNATNRGGGKTLGEIEQGVQVQQYLVNLDILNWFETLRKVYEKVFYVLQERLVKPLIINGMEITREDFMFIPDIKINGSLELADKQLQAQKAMQKLQLIRQAKMDGCATLDNVYNAYEDFIEKDSTSDAKQFITDPKIILQQTVQQLEMKAQQLNGLIQEQNMAIEQGDQALGKMQDKMKEHEDEQRANASADRQSVSAAS